MPFRPALALISLALLAACSAEKKHYEKLSGGGCSTYYNWEETGPDIEDLKCADMFIYPMQGNDLPGEEDTGTRFTLTETLASGIANALPKLSVKTKGTTEFLTEYQQLFQALGLDDADPESAEFAQKLEQFLATSSTGDFVAAPTVHYSASLGFTLRVVVRDNKSQKAVASGLMTQIATIEAVADAVLELAGELADQMATQRYCLWHNPYKWEIIDYDKPAERTSGILVEVRDLADQPAEGVNVQAGVTSPEFGNVTNPISLSSGKGTGAFTMTKRRSNTVSLSVTAPDSGVTTEGSVNYTPMCAWMFFVEGERTYDATNLDWSPLTINEISGSGTITMEGSLNLEDGLVTGQGFYREEVNIPTIDLRLQITQSEYCDGNASDNGTTEGGLVVAGTQNGDAVKAQIASHGQAAGGSTGVWLCNNSLYNTAINNGFSSYLNLGEISFPLEHEYKTELTGSDDFSSYQLSFELKRVGMER